MALRSGIFYNLSLQTISTMNTSTSIFGIVALICAIWVIYDVWTNQKKMSGGKKILWTILAIVFNILTAIIYYFVRKK